MLFSSTLKVLQAPRGSFKQQLTHSSNYSCGGLRTDGASRHRRVFVGSYLKVALIFSILIVKSQLLCFNCAPYFYSMLSSFRQLSTIHSAMCENQQNAANITFDLDPSESNVFDLTFNACVKRCESEDQTDNHSAQLNLPLVRICFDDSSNDRVKKDAQVSHYDRICTLGTGSFGRVTLVRHQTTKGYYALKMMSIREIINNNQVNHVHSERHILENVSHPFIARLYWAYRDDKFLYMLFDYAAGGELFSYLRYEGRFSNEIARFYASEIISALDYLHNTHNIVYRDLKPENVLLDAKGHCVLVDFGFAKVLTDRTWTMCGTAEYLAPEVLEGRGHNKAVDWWALGIFIFEMLTGRPPFREANVLLTYQAILDCAPVFPKYFDRVAKDLVRKLLTFDRTKRLGNMKGGAEDVKNHKWFRRVNWEDVYNKKRTPPILPKVDYEGDTGNFDEYDEEKNQTCDYTVSDVDLQFFDSW